MDFIALSIFLVIAAGSFVGTILAIITVEIFKGLKERK